MCSRRSQEGQREKGSVRKSLLLIDPDPLLRWSVATHLQEKFDVTGAESTETGQRFLQVRAFDAVVLSDACGVEAMRRLEEAAQSTNEAVTIVRLISGVVNRPPKASVRYVDIEKPFELSSLSRALAAGLP